MNLAETLLDAEEPRDPRVLEAIREAGLIETVMVDGLTHLTITDAGFRLFEFIFPLAFATREEDAAIIMDRYITMYPEVVKNRITRPL